LQDYIQAREYVTYYNSLDIKTAKSRPAIENLEFLEAERQEN